MQKKKGISLIVLVITIIVMIILAAAIILSLNNAGIIGNANKAVSETDYKNVQTAAQLKYADIVLGENTNGVPKGDYIKSQLIADGIITAEQANFYRIKNNGDVIKLQTQAEYEAMYAEELSNLKTTDYTITNGVFKLTNDVKSNIEVLAIPYGVTTLDYGVARDCTNLTKVIIPDTVTHIRHSAFYNCTKLEEIIMSKNIFDVGDWAFKNTLWYNNEIAKAEGDNYYIIKDNILIDVVNETEEIIIPDDIEVIGIYAFDYANKIKKIYIPENVRNIGEHAFFGCEKLIDLKFEAEMPEIGWAAFGNSKEDNLPISEDVKRDVLTKNTLAFSWEE